MNPKRLVYQNWIVELGRDPSWPFIKREDLDQGYNQTIVSAVNQAMSALDDDETELVLSYYWQGRNYREISQSTGKAVYKLESLRQRAFRKLKLKLEESLGGKYNVPTFEIPDCCLCHHPELDNINDLIRTKTSEETWKRIIRTLRIKYGVKLSTVQILISHHKYHLV